MEYLLIMSGVILGMIGVNLSASWIQSSHHSKNATIQLSREGHAVKGKFIETMRKGIRESEERDRLPLP